MLIRRLWNRYRNNARERWFRRNFKNADILIGSLGGGSPPDVAVLKDGRSIEHPPNAGLVQGILESWYEQVYTPRGFLREGMAGTVIDAGANVGTFSLFLLDRFPSLKVLALEPFEENFLCLERNLKKWGAEGRWFAKKAAVSGCMGMGRMERVGTRSLDHRLIVGERSGGDLETLSLGNILEMAGKKNVAFLKMDIEGSEYAVFDAADQSDLLRFERISVEYHDHLVPGSLSLMRDRLSLTHNLRIVPSQMDGCGILLASRK